MLSSPNIWIDSKFRVNFTLDNLNARRYPGIARTTATIPFHPT